MKPEEVLELMRSAPERYVSVRAAERYRGDGATKREIPQLLLRSEVAQQATEAGRDLLVGWFAAFAVEALGEDADLRDADLRDAVRSVEAYLGTEGMGLYLWEVGGNPVSMAGCSRPTPSGVTVNYVYTPPEHRSRGYASACVAALSQLLLDEGYRYCFPFTDLANPTSNKIYRAVGYEPVWGGTALSPRTRGARG